jgi:hypothetical protein
MNDAGGGNRISRSLSSGDHEGVILLTHVLIWLSGRSGGIPLNRQGLPPRLSLKKGTNLPEGTKLSSPQQIRIHTLLDFALPPITAL